MLGKLLNRNEKPQTHLTPRVSWPIRVESSINAEELKMAWEDLRMNEVELDILSNAIRHIYEAETHGRISKEERDRLTMRYRGRIMEVRDTLTRSESMVTLYQLEQAQRELANLFNQHFGYLNKKVGELRWQLGLATPEKPPTPSKVPTPQPKTPEKEKSEERAEKEQRKQKPPVKNEAEERIDKIRMQIEAALDKLSNIEAEA